MPGISGGILGDFNSGWRLFPKMPGVRFGVVECSRGGGDLNGLSENRSWGGKKVIRVVWKHAVNWNQTLPRRLEGLPGHWAPALSVLSTWRTVTDPAPPSPALSRQPRALCLLRHYTNRMPRVSTQSYYKINRYRKMSRDRDRPHGKAHVPVYSPMPVLQLRHDPGEDSLPHLRRQSYINPTLDNDYQSHRGSHLGCLVSKSTLDLWCHLDVLSSIWERNGEMSFRITSHH